MAATQVIVAAFLTVTGLVSAQVPYFGGPNYGIGGLGFGYLGGVGGFGPFSGGLPPYYGAAHLPWTSPIGGGIGTTHTVSHTAHGTVPHPVGTHVSTTHKTLSVHHNPTTHVTTVHHAAPAVTGHVQHLNSGFPGAWTYPYPGFSPYFPQYPGSNFVHQSTPIVTHTSVEKTTTQTTDSSSKDKKDNYQPSTIYVHHNPVQTVVTKTHHAGAGYPYNLPGVVSTTHHTVAHPNPAFGLTHPNPAFGLAHPNPAFGLAHLPAAFSGAFPYPGLDYGHGLPPGPVPGVFAGGFPYLNAGLHAGGMGSMAVHHPGVGIPPFYAGAFGGYYPGSYPFDFSTITSSSATTTGKDTKSSSGKSTSSSKN